MVGIDEVGRGCLAGPLLVVAARAKSTLPEGLADSKALSKKQRNQFLPQIIEACELGEGWVKPAEIDRLGLAGAMRLGVRRAIKQIKVESSEPIVMDGPINYLPKTYTNVQSVIDADALNPLVSAASIYAKVRRDEFMIELSKKHSLYGFESNVGYGTRQHLEALNQHGYRENIHRRLFAPVLALAKHGYGHS